MSASKGSDEMYCRSCGDVIKKAAEICPGCGVRNEAPTATSSRNPSVGSKPTHDPTQYETTVSENWYYAVAGSVVLWILLFGLSSVAGSESAIAGFLMLAAWVAMPVGVYFDKQYVRANAEWDPNTVLWVVLSLVPLVNVVAGVVYLYRRHEVLGVP